MRDNVNDGTVRGVAHHEAAHIVIACVLQLGISERGLKVSVRSPDPTGEAHFEGAMLGADIAPSRIDKVIVALLAGGIAHSHFPGDVKVAVFLDQERITELLGATSFDSTEVQRRCGPLQSQAQELVGRHWPLIQKTATELCGKEWHYLHPGNGLFREKSLTGQELKLLLAPMPLVLVPTIE